MADIWDTSWAGVASWLTGPRGWQAVLASGLVVLSAAGATVVLTGSDPASADTRIEVTRLAAVYLPNGSHHDAVEGEVLPRGAELHTGAGGGAQLVAAGRRTYVGALSTLSVQDGVRETLSKGLAMVDARSGARLDLTTPAGVVSTPAGAVARIEEELLTRVAVYDGTVAVHPVGRTSTTSVSALHQVQVQPQALPERVTPLQLQDPVKHDAWEQAVAADLVSANVQLNDLASGLQSQEGATYLSAAPATYRTGGIPAAGSARGEEALGVAVAVAAGKDSSLADVRSYRTDRGSWGVVAALVGAPLNRVSAVLSAALTPTTPSTGPTTVNAGGPQLQPTVGGTPSVAPSPTGSRPVTSKPSTPTKPTKGPTSTPTSTPTTQPGLVDGLLTTVLTLVSPKPAAAPDPKPTPTPTKTTCLLGLLNC